MKAASSNLETAWLEAIFGFTAFGRRIAILEARAVDSDGWMETGDIATINESGYVTLVDRAKDAIKSGGEWISSVEIEKAALSHDVVQMAAAIGIPHPKWAERPALYVVLREGSVLSQEDLLQHMSLALAKWCIPDEVHFVSDIPMTATGKINKIALRELYRPTEEKK